MKGILFPVVIFALALDVSGSKMTNQMDQIKELSEKTKVDELPASQIQQNSGRRCEWEPATKLRGYSCENVQTLFESDPDLNEIFRKACPSGDLDLCFKAKRSDGKIVRGCLCSSQIEPEYHSACGSDGKGGRVCLCSDEDYCNEGNDFYSSRPPRPAPPPPPNDDRNDGRDHDHDASGRGESGSELPPAFAATTLVILGLFGPSFF